MTELIEKRCLACEGGVQPLTTDKIKTLLTQTPKWTVDTNNKTILRTFTFKNYYQTMAFVNAIAWMTHYENHHPDLEIGYNRCCVNYTTHAIDGLSENDFICAAKVDILYQQNVLVDSEQ